MDSELIRRYANGSLTTIAGTGEKGDRVVANDPLQTQLNRPHGVFMDREGVLYVSDSDNHRVLKLKLRR